MDFSAVPLGKALGIEVRQPYLFPKVVDYALGSLAREDLVGPVKSELLTEDVRRGIERFCRAEDLGRLEGVVTHGKLALREAFPGVFSAWRSKDPIEVWGQGYSVSFIWVISFKTLWTRIRGRGKDGCIMKKWSSGRPFRWLLRGATRMLATYGTLQPGPWGAQAWVVSLGRVIKFCCLRSGAYCARLCTWPGKRDCLPYPRCY
jgi:hypothetical protein